MSVIDPDACLRHHAWNDLDAAPGEMQTCSHCGGLGKVVRPNRWLELAWKAVWCLVLVSLVMGGERLLALVFG